MKVITRTGCKSPQNSNCDWATTETGGYTRHPVGLSAATTYGRAAGEPMTTPASPADEPTTTEEFHTELRQLVRRAEANGVDVEGGWACSDGTGSSMWDVEIVEVQQPRTPASASESESP